MRQLAISAVLYVLMPIDLVPDWLIGVGLLDDAAVIGWVIAVIKHDLDEFREWERLGLVVGARLVEVPGGVAVVVLLERVPVAQAVERPVLGEREGRDRVLARGQRAAFDVFKTMQVVVTVELILTGLHRLVAGEAVGRAVVAVLRTVEVGGGAGVDPAVSTTRPKRSMAAS